MAPRVGFIGTGAMGAALIRGLAKAGGVELHGYDVSRERLAELARDAGLKPADSVRELAEASDYVVLAVKPQQAEAVLRDLAPALVGGRCLLSIAAGLTQAKLRDMSGGQCPVVRVMPNTPALVGGGVFAVCLEDAALTGEQKAFAEALFKPLGQVHVLEEKHFDAFTALVGSGPAYVFYVMDALVEAGVSVGLPRAQATEMVKALLAGSAKLTQESAHHLCELREMVTSPAGTTVEGLLRLDQLAVRGALADAVRAAYRRSKELG